jgi:hypothetical protein
MYSNWVNGWAAVISPREMFFSGQAAWLNSYCPQFARVVAETFLFSQQTACHAFPRSLVLTMPGFYVSPKPVLSLQWKPQDYVC